MSSLKKISASKAAPQALDAKKIQGPTKGILGRAQAGQHLLPVSEVCPLGGGGHCFAVAGNSVAYIPPAVSPIYRCQHCQRACRELPVPMEMGRPAKNADSCLSYNPMAVSIEIGNRGGTIHSAAASPPKQKNGGMHCSQCCLKG